MPDQTKLKEKRRDLDEKTTVYKSNTKQLKNKEMAWRSEKGSGEHIILGSLFPTFLDKKKKLNPQVCWTG